MVFHQAVGAARPDFIPPRADQSCFEKIRELAKRVVAAVVYFFTKIGEFFLKVFRCLFCINENPVPAWEPEPWRPNPVVNNRWRPDPIARLRPNPVVNNRWRPDPIARLRPNPVVDNEWRFLPEPVIQHNIPVDLEALREGLRTGREVLQISSQMTAENFCTLCQDYPIRVTFRKGNDGPILRDEMVQECQMISPILEQLKQEITQRENEDEARRVTFEIDFPNERKRIGKWAKSWAEAQTIKVDPQHPYFEIIQAAFQHQDEIPGGPGSSPDYTTYSPHNTQYYATTSQFTYTIFSLIGFQEIVRPENLALFCQLDSWSYLYDENPGYPYISAASKIYTYPRAGDNTDIRNKVQNGVGALWMAYQSAKSTGQIAAFLQECFNNEYCFDARVSALERFSEQHMDPRFEDFNPKIVHRDRTDTKVTRYAAAFRHRQMDKYVNEHPEAGLNYTEFKRQVNEGLNNQHVNDFEASYYTRDRFAQYLEEEGQPIREKTRAPDDLPKIDRLRFDPAAPFLMVNDVDRIPAANRVVNSLIALSDGRTWYKVRIHRVEPNRIHLDLRGDPIQRDTWEPILDAAYMM